jgi:hypothetical protein
MYIYALVSLCGTDLNIKYLRLQGATSPIKVTAVVGNFEVSH